jgi:streptogramin lyase
VSGIAVTADGTVFLAEAGNHRVLRIDAASR